MTDQIRSGQEVLDEFFTEIASIEGVDQDVANIVINLYREGKLTDTNLSNELAGIRGEKTSDKD
ncbi:unnamed protein product [marine sediment metagenome]|uniref:Uncharacterized protein n=1 Tax=marine sediment metagenome TaxID=412755 RepID=X1LLQ5_9ZZZZ